eukprot:gene11102-biopygen8082
MHRRSIGGRDTIESFVRLRPRKYSVLFAYVPGSIQFSSLGLYSIELPHGGLKQSGCGKDISHLALRDYYDVRRITIKRS